MKKSVVIFTALAGVTVAVIVGVVVMSSVLHKRNNVVETIPTTVETSEWVMPTNPTDFTPTVEEIEEPTFSGESYVIHADAFDFEVDDTMLSTFDSFISSSYLQSNLAEVLFDVPADWVEDTYTYVDGVMSVSVESGVKVVIDTKAGTIVLE